MKLRKRWLSLSLALLLGLGGCGSQVEDVEPSAALVPTPLPVNRVERNPYMADCDNAVHNDSYSSDVTDAVLPLGIHSALSTSLETQNVTAPSAAFYDEDGYAITPFRGGVAITEMDGDTIQRLGVFVPAQHDTESYVVQISYSFVDSEGHVVLPTSHGHVIVLQTKDENGEVLPVFQKILDVDISGYAKEQLGEEIDTNLLSIVYDYRGNLWFVTGGFRIYPDRNPGGFLGYLSREYIEKAQNGEPVEAEGNLFLYKLADGEGAENGISSNQDGAVILTNKACYMLRAEEGVEVAWRTEYGSNGTNDAEPGSSYTGGGLAYGSGTTPTLTPDLVLFTDNLDPVNLVALSSETGEVVAEIPVLDQLGEDVPVSVENSILVYSPDESTTSVLVCNWFGAGNAGLADPDADSSVQSYDNIYDANWAEKGNAYIAPGVERVDILRDQEGYTAQKVWLREDIADTSMIKLSTATGYLYGYWQNLDTGVWCYEVLSFATGETVWEEPVSDLPAYNNMAVGMIADVKGNGLYCPTNNMEMVVWQDAFAYLPGSPVKALARSDMERYRLTADGFAQASGTDLEPATYLMFARVENIGGETVAAFRVNGLEGTPADYTLFCQTGEGTLKPCPGEWMLCDPSGEELAEDAALQAGSVYEIRFPFADNDGLDLDPTEQTVKLSAILAF